MRTIATLVTLSAAVACAARPPAPMPQDLRERPGPEGFNARVVVDEARGEVVVWAGPFRVEPSAGGHAHGGSAPVPEGEAHADRHEEHGTTHDDAGGEEHAYADAGEDPPGHEGHTRSPVIPIEWPADGYLRGFELDLQDGAGNPLPRSLMHHLIGVNFDRRMLLYPVAERLFGIGTETGDTKLPKTMGVPLEAGQDIGFYVMWDNSTGETLDDVYVRLALPWTPASEADDIVEVLPFYADVNLDIGSTDAYDLEPGHSVRRYEFQAPAAGRLIAASGHLHDFGTVVRLEDARTDEVLLEITPKLDEDGMIRGISRKIMGVWHGGVRLEEGHTYRVVGVYDSPLAETVPMGAMAHIVGLFAPDDLSRLPDADPDSEIWALDLSGLPRQTGTMTQARDAIGGDGGGR